MKFTARKTIHCVLRLNSGRIKSLAQSTLQKYGIYYNEKEKLYKARYRANSPKFMS